MSARLVLSGLVLLAATGARCVDTEPGLDATVQRATVYVREVSTGPVVGIELEMRVRVGKYALAGRDFIVPRADVFVGEAGARINLGRPEDFDGTLEPGQSQKLVLQGETPAGAFPEVAAALCPDMPEAEVKVDWEAQLRSSDTGELAQMEMGMATTTTDAIRCE